MTGSYGATPSKERPTDPASVDVMIGSYCATNTPHRPRVGGRHDWQLLRDATTRTRPTDPASVDVMTGSYSATNTPHPTPRRWTS